MVDIHAKSEVHTYYIRKVTYGGTKLKKYFKQKKQDINEINFFKFSKEIQIFKRKFTFKICKLSHTKF